MTNAIKNKVTVKLYGDQQLQHDIVKWLEAEKGLKPYGKVAGGNPYTTQKGDKGWAATITFFKPDNYAKAAFCTEHKQDGERRGKEE